MPSVVPESRQDCSDAAAMPSASFRSRRLGVGVLVLILGLDQLSKWWIVSELMTPPQTVTVTPFFNLILVWNRGVSFSLLSHEADLVPYGLAGLSLVIAGWLGRWLWQQPAWRTAVGLGMVIGGALGNVIDRLRFGAVADFLDFHALGWHFATFNVADGGISLGVMLILIDSLFGSSQKP